MSKISLSPSPTGSAVYTIASPAGSTDRTLTLPDATATLLTNAGGTLTGGLTMGGQLNLGSTGQIVFPATQNASANANTLDDYEEGTFNPTIFGTSSAGTATYSSQAGSYTRVGRAVTIIGFLAWSSHTGTGFMRIGNLPFPATSSHSPLALSEVGNLALSANNVPMCMTFGSTNCMVLQTPVGGGLDGQVNMDASAYFRFGGTYFTD